MEPEVEDLRPALRYILPKSMRTELGEDFGPIVADDDLEGVLGETDVIIAVGDIVSMDLKKRGITPRAFICDFKTHRDDENPEFKEVLGDWGDKEVKVLNPAGTITRKAWTAVRNAVARDGITRIVVNGEEDLLGIPAFLEAPIGAKVVYGSPGKGAVVVDVTAAFQHRIQAIVAKFDQE